MRQHCCAAKKIEKNKPRCRKRWRKSSSWRKKSRMKKGVLRQLRVVVLSRSLDPGHATSASCPRNEVESVCKWCRQQIVETVALLTRPHKVHY